MVASAVEVMNENVRMIEKLDFIFSKGKLSADLDCTEPMINTERRIVLKDARHPLMNKEVNVPLQFEIGTNARGIIITGPNTGGKTVAIKTISHGHRGSRRELRLLYRRQIGHAKRNAQVSNQCCIR